jgi:apolipoprotein N-acyltransferase
VLLITHDSSHPPYIKVAVLQGNIDQYKKFDRQYRSEIIEAYTVLVASASVHKPDVYIWPETAVPGYLPADPVMYTWLRDTAQRTASFHLAGAPFNNGGPDSYNATFLFGSDGGILGWHKKTHLVPFGEFIPFKKALAPYFPVLAGMEDFQRGNDYTVLSINSVLWGPTICSENFFGAKVAGFVRNGAEILVNQTNDAWFFDTAAAEQHFTMNVFRAIENRRSVVVCGNTGISGIIEPSGRISTRSPVFKTLYFVSSVSPEKEITFYTRWNDVFAKLCIAIALFMMFMSLIKRAHRFGSRDKQPDK